MINRYASLKHGLVGCWCPSVSGSFGFRLPDLSQYGNHGTLTNMDPGTDWVPSGGKLALDFDGVDDRVQTASVARPLTITINLWVKLDYANSDNFARLIEHGLNNSISINLNKPNRPNKIDLQIGDSSQAGTWTANVTNQWEMLSVTIVNDGSNNNNWSIFRNGIFDKTGTYSIAISGSKIWYIGGCDPSVTTIATPACQLDDIRIYNRALTPSEISLLYTGGRGVGLLPEQIKHRRKTTAAASNRRRRLICGANC